MKIQARPASTTDLHTLHEIERECFSSEAFSMEEIVFLIKNPNSISLVVQIENEIAGFIIGLVYDSKNGKIGHILTLDVAKKFRRKGVAIRLMKEIACLKDYYGAGIHGIRLKKAL